MEQEKNNIFYRPSIRPEQSYESVSAFPVIVSEEEEVVQETATDEFVKITNDFIELFNTFKKIPEEIQFTLYESNYPMLEYLINYTTERIKESATEEATTSGSSSYEDDDYDITISTSDKTIETIDAEEDDFEEFVVDISQDNFKDAVTLSKEGYEADYALLNKEYLSSMYQVISKYFTDIVECANAISSLDESYLLHSVDCDAIDVTNEKQRYLKDELLRTQIQKDSKIRLFTKTHNQENTLVYMRSFIAAESLRERYCTNEIPEALTSTGFIEKDALVYARNSQDYKYDKALSNYYKYLNSLSSTTGEILEMTTKEARLKTYFLKSGVDIYKTKDKQATDITGKTSSTLSAESSDDGFLLFGGVDLLEHVNIDTESFNDAIGKNIDKVIDTNSINKNIDKVFSSSSNKETKNETAKGDK